MAQIFSNTSFKVQNFKKSYNYAAFSYPVFEENIPRKAALHGFIAIIILTNDLFLKNKIMNSLG
jgi:hypothetical protein